MNTAYLILGSNIENREGYIAQGIKSLLESNCEAVKKSSLYETEPWGFETETSFLNQAVQIETKLSAFELLHLIQYIESENERIHTPTYTSRTLDIDILFFNNEIIKSDKLVVPHAQLANRKFVLIPLKEIAPEIIHPELNKPVHLILDDCFDKCLVKKWRE